MKFKEILLKEMEQANTKILDVQNKVRYSHAQRDVIIEKCLNKRTYINQILKNIDTEVLFMFKPVLKQIERTEKAGYRPLERIAMFIVNRQSNKVI